MESSIESLIVGGETYTVEFESDVSDDELTTPDSGAHGRAPTFDTALCRVLGPRVAAAATGVLDAGPSGSRDGSARRPGARARA